MLRYNCANPMNTATHEYSERVGLYVLIQNRMIGYYAPEFTVSITHHSVNAPHSNSLDMALIFLFYIFAHVLCL